jgi:hypothetical protein
MKIKQMKYIILLIAGILLMFSCEDVIDVDLKQSDTDFYTVEAQINSVEGAEVFLGKAVPVEENIRARGICNAVVTIYDDQVPANKVTLEESNDSAGYYILPEGVEYKGVAGRNYYLNITTGDVVLEAEDFLAPVEKIDSIRVWPSKRGENRFLAVFTYGLETPGKGNYYKWDVYINDTLLYDADRMFIADDELVDGLYVKELEIFTDFYDVNEPGDRHFDYGDTIQVKQLSISKTGFNYYYQLYNQSTTGFLFSVPPANIESNITSSDGKLVLGIFSATDVSASNKVIIDDSVISELNDEYKEAILE